MRILKIKPTPEQYRTNHARYTKVLQLFNRFGITAAAFLGILFIMNTLNFLSQDELNSLLYPFIGVYLIVFFILSIYIDFIIMRCPSCKKRLSGVLLRRTMLNSCPRCNESLKN